MKSWRIVMSTALVSACAIGLHAQTPAGTQSQAAGAGKITLTGCVERADQMTPSGTAATTVDSLSFVLINATKGTADAQAETVGTSGAKNAPRMSMYRLDAEVSKLNPHVGHKVEVTGALDAAAASGPVSDPPAAEHAPKLKVETVKMLSETCAR
jgi:hypothetical protein